MVFFHSVLMPPSLGLLQFVSVPETLISLLPPSSTLFLGVRTWERSIKPALLQFFGGEVFPGVPSFGVGGCGLRAVFGMRQETELGLRIQRLWSWVGFKLKSRRGGAAALADLGGWREPELEEVTSLFRSDAHPAPLVLSRSGGWELHPLPEDLRYNLHWVGQGCTEG